MSEAAVLTAPDDIYARGRTTLRSASRRGPRRELVDDLGDREDDGGYNAGRRRTGLRLTFRGGLPRSLWGRLSGGLALVAILGLVYAAIAAARHMVSHDGRFVLVRTSSILTEGNHHLSRPQLLTVFAEDIGRNLLQVSLDERKADLEQVPWVKHATLMRLLPDRLSVLVEERTPIAFVRHGGHIGLVDADGVLLDRGSSPSQGANYSFPVVAGIEPSDPLSVRMARMRIFEDFTRDLDATGEGISAKLSEIDLSNPEDVRALIPDRGSDVLVHFGDSDYLDRYHKYEAHLAEWRAQYPKLSSVDMRYERQVVLEMQAGTAVPIAGTRAGEPSSASPTPASAAGKALSGKAHGAPHATVEHSAATVTSTTPKTSSQSHASLSVKAGRP